MSGKRARDEMSVQVERRCSVRVLHPDEQRTIGAILCLHLTNKLGTAGDDWFLSREVAQRIRDELSAALDGHKLKELA